MAMNKREQAMVADLQEQLRLARALRFTPAVGPDVPVPDSERNKLVRGFLYNAYEGEFRVVPACSTSSFHSFGRNDRTDAQGGVQLYSTHLRALQACRNDAERQCAKWLADIDAAGT